MIPLKKDTETSFHTVDTESGPILVPYVIRRSNRSRRIYVSVDEYNQALLTVPPRASIKAALAFLDQCGDWLVAQMAKMTRPKTILEYLRDHPKLSINGALCSVGFAFTNRCPFCEYDRETNKVILRYDPHVLQEARIKEALKKFAKSCLIERLMVLCELKGIDSPSRVTVRDQSSRWGSCSSSRGISLNWRLILLPVHLQDYVILHELAHLNEMNHSKSFWNLLITYDAKTKLHDKQLGERGRPIIALGKVS